MRAIKLLLLALLLASPAWATNYYVKNGGTDNSSCGLSDGAACATITYTINTRITTTGNTVNLARGSTFNETLTIQSLSKTPITVSGRLVLTGTVNR